ncbi:unnamed protein product [Camellia sinensis]
MSSLVSIPSPRSIWKADKLPYMARKWRRVLPRASIDCTPSCLRKLQRSVDDSDELQSDVSLKARERLMMGGGAVKLLVGIPIDLHPVTKKIFFGNCLDVVLHAGRKFGGSSSGYSVSGGLHGVGLSVVNALYEALEVTVWRDGMEYQQKYSCGKPLSTLMCHERPDESKDRRGTHIKFWPDKTSLDSQTRRLYITITLKKEDTNLEKKLYSEYRQKLMWLFSACSDAYSDTMLGYANSIHTIDGGTHIDGMKASLTRNQKFSRKGLTCVISVKVADPEFEGQMKRQGWEYLELHPDVLDSILSKSLNALKAALAAKRARELVRQKSVLTYSSLPGKLADCSATNPEDSEAVLPLRVKILNIERKDKAAMYKNEEIQNLILGLGLGVKRALFDEGCIYVGVPPLYKVERGKKAYYCYDDAELKQLQSSFPSNASFNIQRFKAIEWNTGLGEMMPLQLLRETTLDPEKRLLKQLMVEDAAEANVVFSSLMGSRVDYRKELMQSSASMINLDQLDI